jgi:hypothetical protein
LYLPVLVYGLPLDLYIWNLSQRMHSAFPMTNKKAECSPRVRALVQSFKVIGVRLINPTSNSVRHGYSHYNHGFFFKNLCQNFGNFFQKNSEISRIYTRKKIPKVSQKNLSKTDKFCQNIKHCLQ